MKPTEKYRPGNSFQRFEKGWWKQISEGGKFSIKLPLTSEGM
jgi:hypothetical protein